MKPFFLGSSIVQILVFVVLISGPIFYFRGDIEHLLLGYDVHEQHTEAVEELTPNKQGGFQAPTTVVDAPPVKTNSESVLHDAATTTSVLDNQIIQETPIHESFKQDKKILTGTGALDAFKRNLQTCTEVMFSDFNDVDMFIVDALNIAGYNDIIDITHGSETVCQLVMRAETVPLPGTKKQILMTLACDVDMHALTLDSQFKILGEMNKIYVYRFAEKMQTIISELDDARMSSSTKAAIETYKEQFKEIESSAEYKKYTGRNSSVLRTESFTCDI